jgi:hypothetical protein
MSDVQRAIAASVDVFRQAGAEVALAIPKSASLASDLHPLIMKAKGSASHRSWKRAYSAEVGGRVEAVNFYLGQRLHHRGCNTGLSFLRSFSVPCFSKRPTDVGVADPLSRSHKQLTTPAPAI